MSILDVIAGLVAVAILVYVANKLSKGKLKQWWEDR